MSMRPGACLAILLAFAPVASASPQLEEQRAAFRDAYADAELGIWELSAERRALLEDYVLWPDLRAAFLRARLGRVPDAEVRAFIGRYAGLKPARELRYRFALSLAERGRRDAFREIYDAHYADLGVERLDCLALATELDAGLPGALPARARELWLVGHSQVAECDTPFTKLKRAGLIDETLHRQRFALAIEARELSMARYLARSLPDSFQDEARRWSRALGDPERFLADRDAAQDWPASRERLAAAIERLAYADPRAASHHWEVLAKRYDFGDGLAARVSRHVALWLARHHEGEAYDALIDLDGAAVDAEVRRWRVLSALRQGAFADVLAHIDALPADERETARWRYWRGVALAETGGAGARALFAELAGDRSYYGFLAADALRGDYAYGHRALAADERAIASLAADPAFIRARELFFTGLDGRGRSEWDAAVRGLPPAERTQAALLAHRWGWHSRAIATLADEERYDDLEVRYPLPHAAAFAKHATAARVDAAWALGVARSESLFMPDIRSAAGAVGVMQLTPATARRTAQELGEPWQGLVTLTDPDSNIRLGTWFLGRMQARFGGNPVLATAAYNAGPLRVEDWLPRADPLDARIWIETIPYAETRSYVRRVLTAETIFHWRLGAKGTRLSARLTEVPPAQTLARLAD